MADIDELKSAVAQVVNARNSCNLATFATGPPSGTKLPAHGEHEDV
jgi:hypothetical protein